MKTTTTIPPIDSIPVPSAPLFPQILRPRFLWAACVVPLALDRNGALVLAMANPDDAFTRAAIAAAVGGAVVVQPATSAAVEAALRQLYGASSGTHDTGGTETGDTETGGEVPGDFPDADNLDAGNDDITQIREQAVATPVVRLLDHLVAEAVARQASDIHIEPGEDRLRLRFRIDGVLQELNPPSRRWAAPLISRIKILAHLDIGERRLPQDGRMKLVVAGHSVDIRVATAPGLFGENVALRLLDRRGVVLAYDALGLAPPVIAGLHHALARPEGLVLVTGPTGSGKTTTLYAALMTLDRTARKVVTLEDPVEYRIPEVQQIAMKPMIGLNFASTLRAILRHDPDVIVVGEIRDPETAAIAVQAALTGHLVLATLHTNDAASAVTRLRDMGVEAYRLTATLSGVLAQRLVRRLCPLCRQPRIDGAAGLRAMGCAACRSTGYQGRTAVAEWLTPDDALHRLIQAGADAATLRAAARHAGMRPLSAAGADRVRAGETSWEEIWRCIEAASPASESAV